ncbi:carboxyl transferase domain-containing protein [Caproicibacter sp.]|uniref:carboxyl transferase domain-containing protein n=1 Tax=Caproicibacter sp. TaxID=2814884 RepID=UPI003989D9FD
MKNVGHAETAQSGQDMKHTKGYLRIVSLLDDGSFHEVDGLAKSQGGYAEAVVGYGTVEGSPVCVFSQNSDVDGGAMSKAQASKIKKIYHLAVKTGTPVVGIFDSAGGRLNENGDILEAYGEILLHANNLSGVVPQISVVLGPCTGTSAMIAAGADFVVMSDKGELTIATNGEDGTAKEAEKLGLCQIAAADETEAIKAAHRLLSMLPSNNLSSALLSEGAGAPGGTPSASETDAGKLIGSICDGGEFLELSPQFGCSAVTGLAYMGGSVAGFTALSGVIDPDSCSKAARFLRFCDSFSIPVITIVNAEKFESLREASKLSSAYSEATTAKITVVTGSAYGPVYIAIAGRGAGSDFTLAWPDAVVSAISPETGAVFLWNDRLAGSENPVEDRKKLIEEYRKTEASAQKAAADGIIEAVVAPEKTRAEILAGLDMLSGKRVSTLPKKHADIQL